MTPRATPRPTSFRVRLLRPSEARDFERLNRAWLEQHFEAHEIGDDEIALLRDPWAHVGAGGRVFAAVEIGGKSATTAESERVVGVCALITHDEDPQLEDSVELAKLGVDSAARGRGVGSALVRAVIAAARVMGKRRVRLNSDTRLRPAMRLYLAHGFELVVSQPQLGRRGDVEMLLELDTPQACDEPEAPLLLADGARYAVEYERTLGRRAVFPCDADIGALAGFDEPLPEGPCDARAALAALHRVGSPATVASTGGRYFGFVIGGALPATVAASWLASAWDQNAGMEICSPTAARLEEVCERWLVDIFGVPARTSVGFVTGATGATFCALAAARHELLRRRGWDVEADGLYGAPPLRVVVGEQAHTTVFKALALLGLGRARVERVPVDAQGRMRADELPQLDDSTIVVAQAGNVDSGAFDALDAIADKANGSAWLHVDGAFGLWAAAAASTRPLVRGIERCDSWAVDAHKYLNVPYDSGIVMCREGAALAAALALGAAYLQPSAAGRDSYRYTPALSRRARAVEVWTALKTLGRSGVAELVERTCRLARRFAAALSARGFRVLNDVVLNQVLVACQSDAETLAVLREVQRSGECWCGGTRWRGEAAIRISVSSWATDDQDVDRSVASFERARGRLAA